jgi:hypothetical protein
VKAHKHFTNTVRNSQGFISAEFIFALTLAIGFSIVLFALNFSLSMAEIAQYIAYSASRAHAAGHIDQSNQEQLGKDKFTELMNNNVLKPLFNNPDGGWFQLSGLDIRGGGATGKAFTEYSTDENRVPQVGVRFVFQPKVLNLKIALLGNTAEDSDKGFSANITGLLIREPTENECWNLQQKVRYQNILNLDSRYQILGSSGASNFVPMEDNGC